MEFCMNASGLTIEKLMNSCCLIVLKSLYNLLKHVILCSKQKNIFIIYKCVGVIIL